MDKIDLNAPAFGSGAQKVEEPVGEVAKIDIPADAPAEVLDTPEIEEKPNTVKYSRFKTMRDRAIEAEREAQEWRERAQTIRTEPVSYDPDLPSQWVKLYGDTEQSKEAWKVQQQLNAEMRQQARTEALEAVRNERYEEIERVEANIETLDDNFEGLAEEIGRDLTDREQSALLDIVDDYTPKDRYGNYAGEILPFDKAWEIYELKNGEAKGARTQSRNAVASMSNSQSQGQTSTEKAERDKNFNPFAWDAYKSRI